MNALVHAQRDFKQICKKSMVQANKQRDHVNQRESFCLKTSLLES